MRVYDLAVKLLKSEIEDYDVYPISTNNTLSITITNKAIVRKSISGSIDQNELFAIQKLIRSKEVKKEHVEFELFKNEIINKLEGIK